MTLVYLALGANVGDPLINIAKAIELLKGSLQEVKQAPIYRSKAVGVTDQPDFLNTAISGQTDLTPQELFDLIKEVEQKVGRRESFRWGPREIDIDIIFYGDQIVQTADLIIPHPRFQERDFVLRPLSDLNPNLLDPRSHEPLKLLFERLPIRQKSIIA